jgi:hypothetical protein
MTTPKRLSERFGISPEVQQGWFNIVLAQSPGDPIAWRLPAAANYSGPVERTNLVTLQAVQQSLAAELERGSLVKGDVKRSLLRKDQPRSQGLYVRVLDVGQANCSAIHIGPSLSAPILGYYDAGAPIFFHGHTFPSQFNEELRVPNAGFVALSHWDFDHYSLAVSKLPEILKLDWYAPRQTVGYNAAKLRSFSEAASISWPLVV